MAASIIRCLTLRDGGGDLNDFTHGMKARSNDRFLRGRSCLLALLAHCARPSAEYASTVGLHIAPHPDKNPHSTTTAPSLRPSTHLHPGHSLMPRPTFPRRPLQRKQTPPL